MRLAELLTCRTDNEPGTRLWSLCFVLEFFWGGGIGSRHWRLRTICEHCNSSCFVFFLGGGVVLHLFVEACFLVAAIKLTYVGDTSCCHASCSTHMQRAADYFETRASSNDMRINVEKTKEMVFSFSRSLELAPVSIVNASKLLSVTLCSDLSWNAHIDSTLAKCNQRLYLLLHLTTRSGMPSTDLLNMHKAIIRPVLEYAVPVWRS